MLTEYQDARTEAPGARVAMGYFPRHLVLADIEFTTDETARSFIPPPLVVAEVTEDARFTGGNLVRTHRHDLLAWLAEYGIEPRYFE
jgi:hypothetical protein